MDLYIYIYIYIYCIYIYIYIIVTELWYVQYFLNKYQRGKTQKIRKGEQPFLYATHRLDQIHILIKCGKDAHPKLFLSYTVYKKKITQNKPKISNCHKSETQKCKAAIIIPDMSTKSDIHSYKIS